MISLPFSSVFLWSLTTLAVAQNCQCGFSVNSTSDLEHQVFTEYLESDFTHGSLDGWIPQEWAIDKADARGPYGKNATTKNVVLTSEGMQLWVRQPLNEMIPTAEVDSKRTDMLYGSFRMRARMGTANGTCGAMFWYHNNTQEIDMEFLSKQFNESDGSNINLVIQSPASQAAGFNAVYTPGFALPHLPFRPDKDFHEYRFDWTPSQVAFYADGELLHVMNESIPDSGGHMVFNHWSNGDPGWSAGPPTQDTYITISHAHFYFNSSKPDAQDQFTKDCPEYDPTKICTINSDITIPLMQPAISEGSSSNPFSPGSTGRPNSLPTPSSWVVPNDPNLDTASHREVTIYIIVGIVVGLIIVGFIGCMMTIRYWVALKNKLSHKLGFRSIKRPNEATEMKAGAPGTAKSPDTELESQATPVKSSVVTSTPTKE